MKAEQTPALWTPRDLGGRHFIPVKSVPIFLFIYLRTPVKIKLNKTMQNHW